LFEPPLNPLLGKEGKSSNASQKMLFLNTISTHIRTLTGPGFLPFTGFIFTVPQAESIPV